MRYPKILASVLSLLFILSLAAAVFPAEFPQRPIRMIITYSAGGGTDVLGRAFQIPFEKALGGKIVIDCIPGGSTKIGTMEGMKAKPDGHTIILMPEQAWVGFYYSKTYDTKVWEQLTPIGNVTTEPYGFIEVRVESPFKTFADLSKAAKENPGKLSGAGGGASGILVNAILGAAGLDTKLVPFAGAGPTKIALLGGHVDFRICQPTEAIAMIRAGKTRGLAISTAERMKDLPDVPTFKELGISESIILTRSVWGPPNMPPNIVNLITKAVEKATKDPDFIKIVEDQFLYKVEYRPSNRMIEELKIFDKKYGPVFAEAYK
ncbi:MAG: tripartite tricarboxylate transporter substrate binding protein [Deltaproteobacteria bacterium]|nr:tripartite tricarboxylate transporter substrate binding protein [Deltaproteobacteria bacterium]